MQVYSPKSFPIDKAYEFALEKKFYEETDKIKKFDREDLSSKMCLAIRKGLLINLFEKNNVYNEFVEKYWNFGNTLEGQARRARCVGLVERYIEGSLIEDGDSDEDEKGSPPEFRFAVESHLRDFLATGNNLSKIESGLEIVKIDGRLGVEFQIDGGNGRIDILARDANGAFVVIELKNRNNTRRVIGQILYYMAWVDSNLSNVAGPSRGIVILNEISDELKLSASIVNRVKLLKYVMHFDVKPV